MLSFKQVLGFVGSETVVNVYSTFREKSEDAGRVVLESAFATHMAMFLSWNRAYCVYPVGLSDDCTHVLTCFMSQHQRNELDRWLADGRGRRRACLSQQYIGSALEISRNRWMVLRLEGSLRRLRG